MPRTAATVFSLDLRINGNSVTVPTGNFKFSRAVSGFGESGISTGQFEFDLYDEFGDYGEALLAGASARLYEANGAFLPSMEYYISKRPVDNYICHFVAYDIMSKTDMPFDDSGLAFFFENGYKTVDCDTVMNAIKGQCGFDSIGYSDSFGTEDINFTQDQLQDTTCRQLMETVAAAMCGCWTAFGDNGKSVRLNCFGTSPAATTEVSCYAEINMQGKQKITRLIVTDNESGEVSESLTGEYGTVFAVDTPFPAAAQKSWSRVQDKLYTAWNCEKAILTYPTPDIPAFTMMTFGERELLATSFTVSVDSTGVYFSGGSDPQDEEQWRYEDYTQRQLNERVQIGKTVGNTQISKDGIALIRKFVNENARSAAISDTEKGVEKYSFTVGENGVTEFDGAIIDKTDFEYAEKVDDNTAIVAYPGGVKYKCTRTIVDGKHYYKTERIE